MFATATGFRAQKRSPSGATTRQTGIFLAISREKKSRNFHFDFQNASQASLLSRLKNAADRQTFMVSRPKKMGCRTSSEMNPRQKKCAEMARNFRNVGRNEFWIPQSPDRSEHFRKRAFFGRPVLGEPTSRPAGHKAALFAQSHAQRESPHPS
jgi:hypothetical protein